MTRVTFRKEPRTTGLAGIAVPYQTTQIKADKKLIGHIYPPSRETKDNTWSISIIIANEDSSSNCSWRNASFKKRFASEPEAREWFSTNYETISQKYNIVPLED